MLFQRIWVENYCLVARCKLWSAMLEWQIKNGELLNIMEPHTDSLVVFGPHESVWCDRSICIWISSTTLGSLTSLDRPWAYIQGLN